MYARSCPADFQREFLNAICIFERACNNPPRPETKIFRLFLVDNGCVVNGISVVLFHRINESLRPFGTRITI